MTSRDLAHPIVLHLPHPSCFHVSPPACHTPFCPRVTPPFLSPMCHRHFNLESDEQLVGDLFNEGIYDLHIELKSYPYMHETVAERRGRLQARHIMSADVKAVHEVEQVGTLLKLLRSSTHHGFPVVASGGGSPGVVLGVVLREQLLTILSRRKFEMRLPSSSPGRRSPDWMGFEEHAGPANASPPLSADDFLRPWEAIHLDNLKLSEDECALSVNLRPYVNEAALVTMQNAPLRRIQTLFRSMGLRHLLVAESCPRVVGVITRNDILSGGEQHLAEGGEATPLCKRPLVPTLRMRWQGRVHGARGRRPLLLERQHEPTPTEASPSRTTRAI